MRDGDEWVINGEKTFITGGIDADFAMVFAVTDKDTSNPFAAKVTACSPDPEAISSAVRTAEQRALRSGSTKASGSPSPSES